jgi:hypothetical protein
MPHTDGAMVYERTARPATGAEVRAVCEAVGLPLTAVEPPPAGVTKHALEAGGCMERVAHALPTLTGCLTPEYGAQLARVRSWTVARCLELARVVAAAGGMRLTGRRVKGSGGTAYCVTSAPKRAPPPPRMQLSWERRVVAFE